MLSIALESPEQEEVSRLLRQADQRALLLYPTERRLGPDIATLVAQDVRFLVARLDELVVGCGGYVLGTGGAAELKRMFVEATARGRGIGRSILQAIEDEAGREGVRLMQLETGIKSMEARALYRRFGYRERGPFGAYGPDPSSVFMEKQLGPR